MEFKFPENFKWGSATSAHQIEGDNQNDWSEWESSAIRLEGLRHEGKDPADFISGRACDSYNRYREDFDIAKFLNQNVHRFSIEWSRIEPEEGKFDSQAIQHYKRIVKELCDRGIEPMITLWHFTNPVWFAKKGSFINLNSPDYFTRYAKYVVDNLPEVKLWITFNEATTVYSSASYLKGQWPPQHRSLIEWRRANRNIIRSHVSAYKTIKNIGTDSPVNLNNKNTGALGTSPDPRIMSHNVEVGLVENASYNPSGNIFWQKLWGGIYDHYRNLHFWTEAFPYYDFMGLNYYHLDRKVPGSYKTVPKQDWWMDDMGWEIYPQGIYHVLHKLKKFKKPVYITENGTAGPDELRTKYIREHLKWIFNAVKDGVDVRGYLYWSLLDNFEWAKGYGPKFGLVEVDRATLKRTIRPSAYEYAKICKDNSLTED